MVKPSLFCLLVSKMYIAFENYIHRHAAGLIFSFWLKCDVTSVTKTVLRLKPFKLSKQLQFFEGVIEFWCYTCWKHSKSFCSTWSQYNKGRTFWSHPKRHIRNGHDCLQMFIIFKTICWLSQNSSFMYTRYLGVTQSTFFCLLYTSSQKNL